MRRTIDIYQYSVVFNGKRKPLVVEHKDGERVPITGTLAEELMRTASTRLANGYGKNTFQFSLPNAEGDE